MIEPYLWREGETYPEAAIMDSMLANQEIAFNMGYGPTNAANNIIQGVYPETIRTFVFDTGTISNNNFVAIPFNAPNPAGAMVVANYILTEEFQLKMVDPTLWGWLSPISPAVYSEEFQEAVDAMERHPATLASTVLAEAALPEPSAEWVTAMEQGWIENVLEQ
jgi:putative spermidine/putrescine transport system substrate-binding protein